MKKIKKIEPKEPEDIIPEINDRSMTAYNSGDNFNFEEKEFKNNPVASKFFTLFDEDTAAIVAAVIRVKHIKMPSEKWKIFNNNKLISTIEGSKLLKRERDFLNTIVGFQLLIEKSKVENITTANLKKYIKQLVETTSS